MTAPALTPEAAVWIRDHAWTADMRDVHATWPHTYTTCACQWEPTVPCQNGHHHACHRGPYDRVRPIATTLICGPDGIHPLRFPEPYEHAHPIGIGPYRETAAMVWLADRTCRRACPCDCHTAPAAPIQLDLFAEAS